MQWRCLWHWGMCGWVFEFVERALLASGGSLMAVAQSWWSDCGKWDLHSAPCGKTSRFGLKE